MNRGKHSEFDLRNMVVKSVEVISDSLPTIILFVTEKETIISGGKMYTWGCREEMWNGTAKGKRTEKESRPREKLQSTLHPRQYYSFSGS